VSKVFFFFLYQARIGTVDMVNMLGIMDMEDILDNTGIRVGWSLKLPIMN
jgi:hypothetical protein